MSDIEVKVRFFAGAAQAVGVEEEVLTLPADVTVAGLEARLAARGPGIAKVVAASSFLVNAVSARPDDRLVGGDVLDVLPPFAGG